MQFAICNLLLLLTLAAPALADAPSLIAQLAARDFEQREAATRALMLDEAFDDAAIGNALRAAKTPEARHRLTRIAMHRYFARLSPPREPGEIDDMAAVGVYFPDQNPGNYVVRPDQHPGLDRPALLITHVHPGFPAFAHLRPGDLVVAMDGEPMPQDMSSTEVFSQRIKKLRAGDTLTLTLLRAGQHIQAPIVLDSLSRLRAVSRELDAYPQPALYPGWAKHLATLIGNTPEPPVIRLTPRAD